MFSVFLIKQNMTNLEGDLIDLCSQKCSICYASVYTHVAYFSHPECACISNTALGAWVTAVYVEAS